LSDSTKMHSILLGLDCFRLWLLVETFLIFVDYYIKLPFIAEIQRNGL